MLIRPDQAEGAKDKNVIIGDDRSLTVDNKILAREVIQEKTPDGKKNLRIILKPRMLGGQEDSSSGDRSAVQQRPVRLPWWSAPDIQAEASGSGYMED